MACHILSELFAQFDNVHFLDSVDHAADENLATLLLSLDHSAAFDTIDHSILLKRLYNSFGVMGSAYNWLNSYLSSRSNYASWFFLMHPR